jgi:hypothetical protein
METIPLRKIKAGLFFAAALLLAGCGANTAFIAERSRSEALALQDLCRQSKLEAPEIGKADALLNESSGHWKEGDAEKARLASEDAGALYRMALARADKEKAD